MNLIYIQIPLPHSRPLLELKKLLRGLLRVLRRTRRLSLHPHLLVRRIGLRPAPKLLKLRPLVLLGLVSHLHPHRLRCPRHPYNRHVIECRGHPRCSLRGHPLELGLFLLTLVHQLSGSLLQHLKPIMLLLWARK